MPERLLTVQQAGEMLNTGERFPRWKGNIFLGGLRDQQIHRLALPNKVNPNPDQPLYTQTREALFTQIGQMVRDVRQGPDGLLYFATVGDPLTSPGAIMRIEPEGSPN